MFIKGRSIGVDNDVKYKKKPGQGRRGENQFFLLLFCKSHVDANASVWL